MWDCPFVTLCELAQIEVGVGTLGSQQLLMRALLDNVAVIHDQDQVGIHNRRQAVRLMMRPGTPTTVQLSGTSLTTTELPPILTLLPM